MKKTRLPDTDSIQELAEFWDNHDLTDFEGKFDNVTKPVFVRRTAIRVPLEAREVKAVEQMAQAKGVSREELIRSWVVQSIARSSKKRTKT